MSPASSKDAAADKAPAKAAAKAATQSKSAAAAKAEPADAGYAIVEASGQQFWLQPQRYYDLDRLAVEVGSTVSLDKVLLVNQAGKTTLGQPYVKGASVTVKVMEHRRGPKVIVYKMRPKKKTRRKNGHRQELTRVMVEAITGTKG
ncbi:MAG: 50S ribosomal protein L21 [Prochlorococcaceae cyanobacterium]|jgi:large subunit ribosomal protein L21